MSALTAKLDHPIRDGVICSFKVAAVNIYKGAMVGIAMETTSGIPDTGYVTNLIVGNTNPYMFVGIAEETVDNSAGSAGDKEIQVRMDGVFRFSKATAVQADIGRQWSVSDNQTVQAPATKAALVGVAVGLPDSSHLDIRITGYTSLLTKLGTYVAGDVF